MINKFNGKKKSVDMVLLVFYNSVIVMIGKIRRLNYMLCGIKRSQ